MSVRSLCEITLECVLTHGSEHDKTLLRGFSGAERYQLAEKVVELRSLFLQVFSRIRLVEPRTFDGAVRAITDADVRQIPCQGLARATVYLAMQVFCTMKEKMESKKEALILSMLSLEHLNALEAQLINANAQSALDAQSETHDLLGGSRPSEYLFDDRMYWLRCIADERKRRAALPLG